VTLSIAQLIEQVSKDAALQTIIDLLNVLGFPSTSWQSGSIQRTLFEAVAAIVSQERQVAASLAMAGHNNLSSGDWLTHLSESQFDNQRIDGRPTQGYVVIVDARSTGAYTFDAGDVVVADVINGFRYRNISSGTLAKGGTLPLKVEAESVGANRNVANDTILEVVQGPAGSTVSNPALSSSTTWITQNGADIESDSSLRARNTAKWGTLAPTGGPRAAYEYWARMADASVRRTWVDDSLITGNGQLTLYIAGDDGDLSASVAAIVKNYIEGGDGFGRRPLGVNLTVTSATEVAFTFTATVYMEPSHVADAMAQEAVVSALYEYFKTIPIGGVRVGSSTTGKVLIGQLYRVLLTVPYVVNVALTPNYDVELNSNEVAVPNINPALTFLPANY
jgi:uncharacterized phage protein gp47/JayE